MIRKWLKKKQQQKKQIKPNPKRQPSETINFLQFQQTTNFLSMTVRRISFRFFYLVSLWQSILVIFFLDATTNLMSSQKQKKTYEYGSSFLSIYNFCRIFILSLTNGIWQIAKYCYAACMRHQNDDDVDEEESPYW